MSMINRNTAENHAQYMKVAMEEARKAELGGEVPVGSVIVDDQGNILAATHNQTIRLCDPTAHAEILALRQAARKMQNYRLLGTTLYVTVEPCVMCMGAIVHARIAMLVFGTPDEKWGAAGSIYHFANDPRLNHQPEVIGGICEAGCKSIIQHFFQKRRIRKA